MEEKRKNRTYQYIDIPGKQEFVYEEDEESCFYYDQECMEEKTEGKRDKNVHLPKRK